MRYIDLKNKKFGRLTAIERLYINSRTPWKCICECGKEKIVSSIHLRNNHTRSCGCLQYEHGKRSISWKGYGDIPNTLYENIKSNAKNRNILFSIKIEYLWELFLKQNRLCSISGLELDFTYGRNRKHKGTASIDRIDSSKGYVEGNVQWVHKDVNYMKQSYSMTYFLDLCNKITVYNKI